MAGGGALGALGALAKGIFTAVGKFFRESAEELRAPFRDLSLGGKDFALAGAGGGTLSSRRFGDEMRQWAKDAGRKDEGIAYSWRNAKSKTNTSGGKYASKDGAKNAAKEAAAHGGRARFRDACGRDDHVHTDYYNKNGEIIKTEHYEYPKDKKK